MGSRPIEVSTDVYAAIWAERRPGEDSEEQILARVLKVKQTPPPPKNSYRVGWADPKHGVSLAEGEQIFRVYKGKEYRATATNGQLVMENGVKCNSLNQLSRRVHSNVENAWNNWYFMGADGKRQLITTKRSG
jgi:hypothetical protein